MGDIFSLGFGPFRSVHLTLLLCCVPMYRWVCTSGLESDLATTDLLAAEVLEGILAEGVRKEVEQQYQDNLRWIREAGRHKLVVGSQARILYSDMRGRAALAARFNRAVQAGRLAGPVVISR